MLLSVAPYIQLLVLHPIVDKYLGFCAEFALLYLCAKTPKSFVFIYLKLYQILLIL